MAAEDGGGGREGAGGNSVGEHHGGVAGEAGEIGEESEEFAAGGTTQVNKLL